MPINFKSKKQRRAFRLVISLIMLFFVYLILQSQKQINSQAYEEQINQLSRSMTDLIGKTSAQLIYEKNLDSLKSMANQLTDSALVHDVAIFDLNANLLATSDDYKPLLKQAKSNLIQKPLTAKVAAIFHDDQKIGFALLIISHNKQQYEAEQLLRRNQTTSQIALLLTLLAGGLIGSLCSKWSNKEQADDRKSL